MLITGGDGAGAAMIFYAQYTTNERSDRLIAMSLDGKVTWKTDQQRQQPAALTALSETLRL